MPSFLPYISFISGIGAFYLFRFFPASTALLFLLLFAFFYKNHRKHVLIYSAIALLTFCYAWVRYEPPEIQLSKVRDELSLSRQYKGSFRKEEPQPFSGVVSGLPVTTRRGYIQEIKLISPEVKLRSFLTTGRPLVPGSRLQGFASMSIKEPHINPGSRGKTPSLFLKTDGGVVLSKEGSIWWLPQRIRWRLYNYFRANFTPDAASLLSAIVIGHRESGNNTIYTAYSKVGLAHLMSISGTHFGLFTLLVFFLIRYSARSLPYSLLVRLTSRLSLDEITALLTFPLIIFYLLISGGRIPAVRSFLMINLFLLGLLIGRKGQWLYSLLIAATVILIIDPESLRSISFQLSFIAVFFIGLTMESFEGCIRHERFSPSIKKILGLTLVTAGALIGTSPLVLYYFHFISTLSMPANMIFTPLICFIILPLGLFGGVAYLITGAFPFAGLLQKMTSIINSSVLHISNYESITLPLHAFPFILLVFIYPAIYFCLKKRWRLSLLSTAGLMVSVLLTFVYHDGGRPRVTFLDVGQGDAAVIESSGGRTIVVDTSYSGREVIDYLRYKGVKEVDALILSHGDKDHVNGLGNILAALGVKEVWDNGLLRYIPPLQKEIIHRRLEKGELLRTEKMSILILHPQRGYYSLSGSEDNNHSLVLRFQEGDLTVLFTGDIEADAEEALLVLGKFIKNDVLKVAHHGSHTSSTGPFVNTVNPAVTVISAGKRNPYGHPHKAALMRLSGFPVFRTDLDGALRTGADPRKGIVVKRFRDYGLKPVKGFRPSGEIDNLKRLFLLW